MLHEVLSCCSPLCSGHPSRRSCLSDSESMDHPDKDRCGRETAGATISDSDDDVVRSGERSCSVASSFGQHRTKGGHPIYSREDIREQYCINSKELEVFEEAAYAQNRLFGCLSLSHLPDHSPCNKSSLLPDCVKRKTSLDSVRRFALNPFSCPSVNLLPFCTTCPPCSLSSDRRY